MQAALDAVRRGRGLYSVEQTRAWMKATGASEETLRQIALGAARTAKLRDAITTDRAHEYSREHARDFDWISLAQFSSRSHAAAEEIAVAIRHGHGFYEMAETALRQGRCAQQSYFRRIPRHALVTELRPLIDAAQVGSVVGPVPEAEVYLLVKLVAVESVGVEYAMTAAKRKLFDEWLAERRSAARIEWFWGSARRTAPA